MRQLQFIYEHLTKWCILDVLRYFAVQVGDVATAAQMVWVVVELHPLVSASFASPRLDHRPCLCCLWRVVITAKAFAIDIIGIVLTVVWQIECLVIFLDGLKLLIVLILVIDSHTVSFIARIRYSSWVVFCTYLYRLHLGLTSFFSVYCLRLLIPI